MANAIRAEWFLGVSFATTLTFFLAGKTLFALQEAKSLWRALIFLWLFSAVMGSALAVVRHADHVAEALWHAGAEALVTAIEVMSISAVMLHGDNNPTLVRDTLFAIVMINYSRRYGRRLAVLGGWRHREQHYNLQGANAYLSVIIPLAVLTLSLPNFTVTTRGRRCRFRKKSFWSSCRSASTSPSSPSRPDATTAISR